MEADRVQVTVRAALVQGDADINSLRRRWFVTHCKREAGVLPVRREVSASSGRPALFPRAPEVTGLPFALCFQRQ